MHAAQTPVNNATTAWAEADLQHSGMAEADLNGIQSHRTYTHQAVAPVRWVDAVVMYAARKWTPTISSVEHPVGGGTMSGM